MRRKVSAALIVCVSVFAGVLSPVYGQHEPAPPKELLEYIKDANKLGLKEGQIRNNAVQAGWPLATVNKALTYTQDDTSSSEKSAATTPASSGMTSAVLADRQPPPNAAARTPEKPPASENRRSSVPEAATSVPDNKVSGSTRGVPDDYVIGAGDVLQISVWKEPDASVPNAVVRPDGKVSLPILKEVDAVGQTPTQLEKVITERLSKFIPAADVTVVVSTINSKKIYVLGAVKKEGPISYTYKMTIMQALSEAGGLNDYAKRKKIYVLRMENGKEYRLPFDYNAALKGEHMELNIPLMPGDTLVVPQ